MTTPGTAADRTAGPEWADVRLTGSRVRLEPLALEHVDGLLLAGTEDRASYGFTVVPGTRAEMTDFVLAAVAARDRSEAVPFVIRDLRTGDATGDFNEDFTGDSAHGGRVVGSTRFMDLGFFRPVRRPAAGSSPASFTTVTSIAVGGPTAATTVVTSASASAQASASVTVQGSGISAGGSTRFSAGGTGPAHEPAGPPETSDVGDAGAAAAAGMPSVAEIGSTWLAASAQRTSINTEAKLLLLTHAFGAWSALRICFKTDVRNLRSRAAIERLGARYEGIRRAHMPAVDGDIRDTVYYSITRDEWPGVRAGLEHRLARGR